MTFVSLVIGPVNDAASSLIDVAITCSLMITMRRANGLAAVHDLLFDTRVVRRSDLPEHQRYAKPAQATPAAGDERVGPFVLGRERMRLSDGSAVHEGLDPTLGRAVWIHRVSGDVPPRSSQRRTLARAGRLRWVAGRRTASENWDAYGAPDGEPLLAHASPVSWESCAGWLSDLARELDASRRSGESLAPRLENVWISSGQQALITDFATNDGSASSAGGAGPFLAAVAHQGLHGAYASTDGRTALFSRRARAFLDQLPSISDPAEVIAKLESVAGARSSVSRRERAAAIGLTAIPSVLVAALMLAVGLVERAKEPPMAHLAPFVRRLAPPRDTVVVSEGVQLIAARIAARIFPPLKIDREREHAVTVMYLAAVHRTLLSDTSRRRILVGDSLPWGMLDSVLAANPFVSAQDSVMAVRIVEHQWKMRPPRAPPFMVRALRAVIFALGYAFAGTALLSVAVALLFRRGWASRTAALEFVLSDGTAAGRVRLAGRAVVTWLPAVLILPASYVLFARMRWMLYFVLLAICGVMLAYAIWRPQRGLPDIVLGTHVVPD
jgi:hypothetical protein